MIDKIIEITCRKWGVTYSDVVSRSRQQKLLFARMMIAKLLRQYKGMTLSQIGGLIGRDHATVLYYLKNWDAEFRFNDVFRTFAESVEEELKEADKSIFALEMEKEFNETFGYDEAEETKIWQQQSGVSRQVL